MAETASSLPYLVPTALSTMVLLRCGWIFGGDNHWGRHLTALLPALTDRWTVCTAKEYDEDCEDDSGLRWVFPNAHHARGFLAAQYDGRGLGSSAGEGRVL